ncbi:NAD/FAD-utilizing enzyme [Methylonatrum kenyense]|uniref:NAD/FAD-utilizing enzyme n=1 Tax=Methylonatrum kenyense TaxID=455253 RepID=UPI0020BF1F78|nr:NAD/FAD-utilizing enzyme [Methylonatrum kenyense]MCK8515156.1 NAD/FAD-utilizing enzyme [Methylonatrum kenyense]
MTRYFFISDDLDDLERLEEELERSGIVTPQIHLLTLNESGAEDHHHLHQVTAFMKRDVVHSTLIGAAIGLCLATAILITAGLTGWHQTPAGWIPFVFLAVILLGFCSWEGGLRGIDTPNVHFRHFQNALQAGRHVFFVDLEDGQEAILQRLAKRHPSLEPAGTGPAAPHWVVFWQHRLQRFFADTFP